MINDLFNYIINDDDFKTNVLKQFKYESAVVMNGKQVGKFIGNGCGITYLKIDKRSKKSIELDNIVHALRRKVNNHIYNEWFADEQKTYFQLIGCPVMAVLQQDQQIQIEFYKRVIQYAKDILKIKNISYISNLD